MTNKILLLVFISTLFVSCVTKKSYFDLENEYTSYKKDHNMVGDELDSIKKALNASNGKIKELEGGLKKAQEENKNLKKVNNDLQGLYAGAQSDLELLRGQSQNSNNSHAGCTAKTDFCSYCNHQRNHIHSSGYHVSGHH